MVFRQKCFEKSWFRLLTMVWYGMVHVGEWYGVVWYGTCGWMVWYGMAMVRPASSDKWKVPLNSFKDFSVHAYSLNEKTTGWSKHCNRHQKPTIVWNTNIPCKPSSKEALIKYSWFSTCSRSTVVSTSSVNFWKSSTRSWKSEKALYLPVLLNTSKLVGQTGIQCLFNTGFAKLQKLQLHVLWLSEAVTSLLATIF